MKAIRYYEFGPPDVMTLDEVPDPQAGPGEVLVRLQASGVNNTDTKARSGKAAYSAGIQLPAMLGREGAGRVEAVGSGVTGIALGDRVIIREPVYTYAQLTSAPVETIYHLPDSLSAVAAATIAVTYATAWDAVVNQTKVQPGETVLVQAVASGVGIASVQIAKYVGARVIGTASSAEKLEWATTQGMDDGINYVEQDFVEEAKKLTGGKGVDVVVDGVGADVFLRSLNVVVPHGRVTTYGATAGRDVSLSLSALSRNRISAIGSGSRGTTREDFEGLLRLFEQGVLRTTVDRTWPLAQAAEAHRYIEARQVRGKVALTIE
jgi:NADPH2:quinone reductase